MPPRRGPSPASPPQPGTEKQAGRRRLGCGRILINTWGKIGSDFVTVMAAGVAFFSFLSIFPAMSTAISAFGLIADPRTLARQLVALHGILPPAAMQLLSDQLESLIAAPQAGLGIGLVVSLLLTFWSATSGVSTLMSALTAAFNETETRSLPVFYLRAFALTLGVGAFAVISLLLIAVVPAVVSLLPFPENMRNIIGLVRWPILAALVWLALALVYRFAPARKLPRWHWLAPGTIAAAVFWLGGSAGFSYYVANFGTYNKMYGSLGAVVVLMVWFYVSALIMLVGAELNSEADKARGA